MGLWGVVCNLAVTGTGGPVKKRGDTIENEVKATSRLQRNEGDDDLLAGKLAPLLGHPRQILRLSEPCQPRRRPGGLVGRSPAGATRPPQVRHACTNQTQQARVYSHDGPIRRTSWSEACMHKLSTTSRKCPSVKA
eukprot:1179627-Prorocentrum_minimum.AAC.2